MLIVTFDKNNVFTYPGQKYDSGIEDASIVTIHMMPAEGTKPLANHNSRKPIEETVTYL